MKTFRDALIFAAAIVALSIAPALAQDNQYSHHNQATDNSAYTSRAHVGGSWASQSGYNNHQHHNLIPHRKYYTYEGNQYYRDLDTGIRFRI